VGVGSISLGTDIEIHVLNRLTISKSDLINAAFDLQPRWEQAVPNGGKSQQMDRSASWGLRNLKLLGWRHAPSEHKERPHLQMAASRQARELTQ